MELLVSALGGGLTLTNGSTGLRQLTNQRPGSSVGPRQAQSYKRPRLRSLPASDWFRVVTWPRLWPLIGRRPSSTLIGRAGGSCGSRGTSQVGELSWQLLSRHPDMRSRQKYSGNYFYCVCFQYNDYKLTYSHIIENFQRNYSWWKTFSLPKNMM